MSDVEYKWDGQALAKFPQWLYHPEDRPSQRTTFVSHRIYDKDLDLESSGLFGPVVVEVRK